MKKKHGKISKSENKKFFYCFAKSWMYKFRKENILRRLNSDPHSPTIFRVNGTVCNMPEFYETFDVKPGHKLYKKNPIQIW